jgi:hypothetical protein
MQGQKKINQVMLEQIQAISTQLAKLNVREQGSANSNNTSISTDRSILPSKPETNLRGEAKAITSRDVEQGSEFPNIQEVKGTLRSRISYQGPIMSEEEEEGMRRTPMDPQEGAAEEFSYEKE